MNIEVTVSIPKLIYDIYNDAAGSLGNYSISEVLSSALIAYAQYLFEDMQDKGELDP